MPETTFESVLEIQIRALAEGGVRPVDRYAIADATIAAGKPRRWGIGSGWRQLPGTSARSPRAVRLAFIVVLAVLAAALLVTLGPGRRGVVPPVPVPSNGPSASPSRPAPTAPAPTSGDASDGVADQSIFLRPGGDGLGAMDVVAVNAAGQERLVRRLGADLIKGGGVYRPYGAVGRDGWLSVDVSPSAGVLPGLWMLVDLRDPARPPQFVPYTQVIGGAWSGTGWFATVTPGSNAGFSIDVVDANAGTTGTLGGAIRLPGGGPDLIWAADGSGLLANQPADTDQPRFGIQPRDGSAFRPEVPPLADRRGNRWVTQGGRYLDTCQAPDCPTDRVVVHEADGTIVTWYSGELAPAKLYDASFSQDGSAIWLLLDRPTDGRHEAQVVRLDAPGVVAAGTGTVDLGRDVSYLWFAGLARDGGSQVAIGYWIGPPNGEAVVDGPVAIVPRTANSGSSLHAGSFFGFMPGTLLDSISGEGAFEIVPDAPVPTMPPQPTPSPEAPADSGSTAPPESSPGG